MVIRERTDMMRRLSEELFRYFVVAATAEELHAASVSLNDVLEQSLAGFYGTFSGRGIVLEVHMPEKAVVCRLDAAALRRVLDNLFSNAARYSDGDLVVNLTQDGTILCENATKTLDRVQAERLFDRFYTVESGRGAAGLGLSIARLLTEKMGGQIRADYAGGRLCNTLRFPADLPE